MDSTSGRAMSICTLNWPISVCMGAPCDVDHVQAKPSSHTIVHLQNAHTECPKGSEPCNSTTLDCRVKTMVAATSRFSIHLDASQRAIWHGRRISLPREASCPRAATIFELERRIHARETSVLAYASYSLHDAVATRSAMIARETYTCCVNLACSLL